jgi:ATP-dependent DNA helicase Rep
VQLASCNEGLLPFKVDDEAVDASALAQRLQEERRLMYVGITRARHTLVVSTLRRRKRGRDSVAGVPSRFIAEMKLDEGAAKEDARARLKRVRAELATKSDAALAAQANAATD